MADIWGEEGLDPGGSPARLPGPTGTRALGYGGGLDRALAGTGAWQPVTLRGPTAPRGYTDTPIYEPPEQVVWKPPPRPVLYEPPMPGELPGARTMPSLGQTGRAGGVSGAAAMAQYEPPGFPERVQLSIFGNSLEDATNSAWGPFLGLRSGEVKGGFIEGPGGIPIATTPLTIANAATWGREGLLALGSSLLSGTGRYEQPAGAMFGEQVAGPAEEDKTLLDRFADGVNAVGDAIWAPFEAATEWYRNTNAGNRARDIRAIVATGEVGGLFGVNARAPIDFFLGGDRDTAQKIMAKAIEQGRTWDDMAAQLYDLDPAIVAEIVRNPNLSDEQLNELVKGQPLSRDPAVNILLELTVQGGLLIAGAGAVKGLGAVLKAPRLLGALGPGGRALTTGATGLEKLWRINAAYTLGGWTARGGEWALKEIGGLTGAQGVVDYMDKLMWEMPTSTNPGLNLIDGFGTHAFRTLKEARRGRFIAGTGESRVGVDIPGRRIILGEEPIPELTIAGEKIALSRQGIRQVARFNDVTLADIQRTIFRPLGWTDEMTDVLFGDRPLNDAGAMPPFNRGDAINVLLYHALSEVRARMGDDAKMLNPARGLAEMSKEWVDAHVNDAVRLLADTMLGKESKADWLRKRVQDYYWNRTGEDASELGAVPMYGPFDAGVALLQLRNWQFASRAAAKAAAEVASQMRPDWTVALSSAVDADWVAAARAFLTSYAPNERLTAYTLNRIRLSIPKIVMEPGMNPGGRRGWTPNVTRAKVEKILDGMLESERKAQAEAIREGEGARPALDPEAAAAMDEAAVTAAVGMSRELTRFLIESNATGEMPARLPDELFAFVAEHDHRPVEVVRRSPEGAYNRAVQVFEARLEDASVRGGLLASFEGLTRTLDRTETGDPGLREAISAASEALRRPPKEDWLAHNQTAAGVYRDTLAEAVDTLAAFDAWQAEPVHPIRVVDLAGRPTMLPAGIEAPDLPVLVAAIKTARTLPALTDAHLQLLADPTASIWEKAAAVAPLLPDAPERFTAEQRDLLALAGRDDLFREDLARVMPEVAEPAIADVRALEAQAVAHWSRYDDLVAGVQSIANRIAARPGSGVASDVDDLVARAATLGRQAEPAPGPRSAGRPEAWRETPVETPWHRIRLNRPELAGPVATRAERVMAYAQGRLAALADQRARLFRGLGEERIAWADEPVARARSRPKAEAAVRELGAASPGIAYKAIPDPARRNGWLIMGEDVTYDTIAYTPDAAFAEILAAQARADRPGAFIRIRESWRTRGKSTWRVEEVVPRRPGGVEPAAPTARTAVEEATPGAPVAPESTLPVSEAPGPPVPAVDLPDGRVADIVGTTAEGDLVVQDRLGGAAELVPAEAATPEAVQAAYDAGDIAAGQQLNREVGIARGGTVESGGAVRTPEGPPPIHGAETGFPDPYDETKTIPATFRLVELADLVSSDRPEYPPALQPRDRTGRLASDEQVVEMARQMSVKSRQSTDLLLRTESGAEGVPVVDPGLNVIAGNGRTMALRAAGGKMQGSYRAALVRRATEFGVDPDAVRAMDYPVLVREVPAEIAGPQLAAALNVATGGMSITETAARVAAAITSEDVGAVDFGKAKDLVAALGTEAGMRFAKRILGKLTAREQAQYLAANGALNKQGVDLVQAALMSKLMRDPASNRIVAEFFETGDTDVGRIRNGLLGALKPLLEAHALIESGNRFPNLAIGDALAPAVDRLIRLRSEGLTASEIRDVLASPELIETADDTFARELALVLQAARTQTEITDFFTEYATAVKQSEDPGAIGMFGPPTALPRWSIANAALKEINGRRLEAARAKGGMGLGEVEVLRPFSDPLTGEVTIGEPRMSDTGVTQPAVVEHAPRVVEPERAAEALAVVEAQNPERIVFDDWTGRSDMPEGVPVAFRVSEPGWGAVLAGLRDEGARSFDDRLGEYLRGLSETPDGNDLLAIAGEARAGDPIAWLVTQEIAARTATRPRHLADGSIAWAVPNRTLLSGVLSGAAESIASRLARWEADLARPSSVEIMGPDGLPYAALREADALLVEPVPKAPLTAAEYAAVTDLPLDVTDAAERAGGIAESLAHAVVPDSDAHLAAALKERTGALPTTVSAGRPRNLEFHAPDPTRRLARIEAEEARWQGSLTEAARQRAAADAETFAVNAETPFEDPALADAYARLMEPTDRWETGFADEQAARIVTLGEAVDAIQSIDAGALGGRIDDATAGALRNDLMRIAEGALEQAGGEPSPGRAARLARQAAVLRLAREKPGEAPAVIENPYELPPAMADLAAVLAGKIEEFNADSLDGYTGYQIGVLPRRSKFDRAPLTPRIQYRDFTGEADALLDAAEVTIPGLGAMLAEGPIKTLERSIADGRFSRSVRTILDMAIGPRHEREIAKQALDRWKESVYRIMEEDGITDPAMFEGARHDLDAIVNQLHKFMATHTLVGLPVHRRVATIAPNEFRSWAQVALAARHGEGNLPPWWDSVEARPGGLAELWRDADNRLRARMREVSPGLADAVDRVWYETRLGRSAANKKRGLLVAYNVFRFALDARWQGLEYVEPDILLFGRYGARAWNDLRKLGRGKSGMGKRAAEVAMPPFLAVADRASLRRAWSWWTSQTEEIGMFARARDNAILAAMKQESPAALEDAMLRWARSDPILADSLRSFGQTPEQWLERLARDWEAWDMIVKPASWAAKGEGGRYALLRRFDITEEAARKGAQEPVYPVFREIEEAIAQSRDDPRVVALYERLREIQHDMYDDLAATFYGQPDRSNLQRLFNSPLLYWPVSYQIKATKWLARILFDKAFGVDTGAGGAVLLQKIHDEHARRMRDDPAYGAEFANHRTLLFLAQMLLPVTPFDIGVSISPFTRLALNIGNGDEYSRNLFGVGPGYTYFSLLPRLFYEETKPGGIFVEGSPLAGIGAVGRQLAPYTIPVRPARKSTLQAETIAPVWNPRTGRYDPVSEVPTAPPGNPTRGD